MMTYTTTTTCNRLLLAAVMVSVLFAACGTEERQTPEISDYYPLSVGNTWLYEETEAGTATEQIRYEIVDQIDKDFAYDAVGALRVFVLETTFPSGASSDTDIVAGGWRDEYVYDDGTRVARKRHDIYDDAGALTKTRDYEPGFLRFDRNKTAVGNEWAEEYTRYTDKVDGSAVTQDEVSYLYEVMEPETVTVPAGTFDCVVWKRTETASSGEVKMYYFAPGVGKVKEVTGSKVEALVSYSVADERDAGI